jgi:hypothetical protein
MTVLGSPGTKPQRLDDAGEGQTPADTASALLTTIWPLVGRHIAFHRRLVELTDNVKAALLLSQAVYWTRHGRDIAQRDGWFHKTAEHWEMELGLSAREQTSARDLLRARVLLEEQRLGLPARMHFRLNLEVLGRRLAERVDARLLTAPGTDWHDRMVIAELLGPAVAFHRALAAVAGGIHGGLLLSRALHLTRLQARRQRDVWITDSAAHWFEELGLSRREQEAARRDLLQLGVWEERLRAGATRGAGGAARRPLRRSPGHAAGFRCSPWQRHTQRVTKRRNKSAAFPQSCFDETAKLDSTKPPSVFRRNRHPKYRKEYR